MKSHPCFERQRIFAPGPTPVPEAVLSEIALAPLHHRTKGFIEILERVKENLKFLFQTKETVYLFTASGTGAMEATIVNLFALGDEVLVIDGGKFGERWHKLAGALGLKPTILKVEWGEAVKPEQVQSALKANPKLKGVLFQASETSTGVAHPVREIASVIRECSEALILVDAITALGVSELPMDKWGLDAVVSGSQKALMLPPGLAFLALSGRAQEQRKRANIPNFYYNLKYEEKAALGGETAWTPAVSLVRGLDLVLQKIKTSGLEAIFRHHARLAEATRLGARAMRCELFAKNHYSDAVTSVLVPQGVDGKQLINHLRDRYSMTVAGGQDQWSGKMFRLAHLGFFDELDILTVLSAVEMSLKKLGHSCELGAGPGAAQAFFLKE